MLDLLGPTRCGVSTALCRARGSRTARAALAVAGLAAGFWLAASLSHSGVAYADTVSTQPTTSVTDVVAAVSAPTDQPSLPALGPVSSTVGQVTGSTTAAGSAPADSPVADSKVTGDKPAVDTTGSTPSPSSGLLGGLVGGSGGGSSAVGSVGGLTSGLTGSVTDLVSRPGHRLRSIVAAVVRPAALSPSLPIVDDPGDSPMPILNGYPGHLPCCLPDLPWPAPWHPAPPAGQPIGGGHSGGHPIPVGTPVLAFPTAPRASRAAVQVPRTAAIAPVVAQLLSASGSPSGPGPAPVQPAFMVASVSGHSGSDSSAWLDPLRSSGLGFEAAGPVGSDDLFILHTTAKPSVSPD
ncbi:hypothetical protein [Fodinicola feengrottensis]|uniref:Secreted protein n=1 Tax=Fodinicola feengrottensis TaxID=435914 RepID=A0ABN2GT57_9ACTN|nr:hypothetical protein [Fodinicola feengrottensis]